MQLLQLEVVSVVALGFSFQHLEDGGSDQQVREVGQSKKCRPAQVDLSQLKARHQPFAPAEKITDRHFQTQRSLKLFFKKKSKSQKSPTKCFSL